MDRPSRQKKAVNNSDFLYNNNNNNNGENLGTVKPSPNSKTRASRRNAAGESAIIDSAAKEKGERGCLSEKQQGKDLEAALVLSQIQSTVKEESLGSSEALFRDLHKKSIMACGTIGSGSVGYPKTVTNKLHNKAPRGTHHWLRDGNLLFVEWRDTREVHMCSTIHRGDECSVMQRKVKRKDGQWTTLDLSVPQCVVEYNRYVGGVDVSDALIGYYTVLHKTKKWYQSFFYHFVDIAIVNAFILHRETASARSQKAMTQKQFRETLVEELGASVLPEFPPHSRPFLGDARHLPGNFASDSTRGRRHCKVCGQKTPVYCKTCLVTMCFQPKRDCFSVWHENH